MKVLKYLSFFKFIKIWINWIFTANGQLLLSNRERTENKGLLWSQAVKKVSHEINHRICFIPSFTSLIVNFENNTWFAYRPGSCVSIHLRRLTTTSLVNRVQGLSYCYLNFDIIWHQQRLRILPDGSIKEII